MLRCAHDVGVWLTVNSQPVYLVSSIGTMQKHRYLPKTLALKQVSILKQNFAEYKYEQEYSVK